MQHAWALVAITTPLLMCAVIAPAPAKIYDLRIWHEALLAGADSDSTVHQTVQLPQRLANHVGYRPAANPEGDEDNTTDSSNTSSQKMGMKPSADVRDAPLPGVPPPVLDLPATRELLAALFHVSERHDTC
jgi:hypothetical protein